MPKQKNLTTSTITAGDDQGQENEYEAFVRGLEIIGIALASCECSLDRSSYFKAKDHVRAFNQDYALTEVGKRHFDAIGSFSVVVAAQEPESPPSLQMKFSFQTHFHSAKPIMHHYAERFANSELRLVLVPYARQFVSSVSNQMVVGPIIVPLTKGVTTRPAMKKNRSR